MLKTRLALAALAATAVGAFAAPAQAATATATAPVTAAVVDTLTVAAATPTALALIPGTTSTAVSSVVTITDTTPATPHSLTIADVATTPSGHVAGRMDNTSVTPLGPTKLANPLDWATGATAGPFSQLSGTAATVLASGTLAVDPVTLWFRQTVATSEQLQALQTYSLTATYTVTG
jgi:hypothetical protein